jgi:hypothetical protein
MKYSKITRSTVQLQEVQYNYKKYSKITHLRISLGIKKLSPDATNYFRGSFMNENLGN